MAPCRPDETENASAMQKFMRPMNCHYARSRKVGCGIVLAALTFLLLPVTNAQSDAQSPEAARACQRVAERSSRLECYDRAFPPIVDPVDRNDSLPQARELVAPDSEPELTARIIEVQMPSLSTTLFLAADGRTFVRERATTVIRWPDTPFDAEVQTNNFGTSTYLKLPGTTPRFRVVVRD